MPKPATRSAFVVVYDNPIPYTIDDGAFERWIATSDDCVAWLPDRNADTPGHDFAALTISALEHDVLVGDPRLELQVNGDDDSDGAGYYVLLHNREGEQSLLGITSGWSELDFPYADGEENPPLAQAARFHLHQACSKANSLLSRIQKTSPDTRISEAEFRAKAPQMLFGIEIVEISRFDGGSLDAHTYAHAAALTRRGEGYSTHLLIYRDDQDDFLLEHGRYDFPTRSEAEEDSRTRAACGDPVAVSPGTALG